MMSHTENRPVLNTKQKCFAICEALPSYDEISISITIYKKNYAFDSHRTDVYIVIRTPQGGGYRRHGEIYFRRRGA